MLKLFTAHNSICTQKVFLTLIEKDLPWTSDYVDLFNNEQYRPEYLKLNPKGVVPTLIHRGHAIIESTLICEYLDQTFPEPSLVPASAYERSQMRRWSKHIDEGVFEATREISFSAMFRDKMRGMTQEQRDGRFRNIGDPGRRARMISTYEAGCDSPFVEQGIFAFEKMFGEMEECLSDGRPWLVGRGFSLADINVMPFAARLDYLSLLDVWIADRPGVRTWWQRARTRPSFAAAIAGLLSPEQIEAMSSSGSRIRDKIATKRDEIVRNQAAAFTAAAG
ncbi:MAG TPA: glutathione S-transferase family protein [Xanthobacteraceae bacterium]|nr:glutathione S-transferase family protein [Xanthobacteraceae bacterium]